MRCAIIAHRGVVDATRPENTLGALARAVELGADGVELDVRVTADREVVVLHDAHTGRVGDRALFVAKAPARALRTVQLAGDERVPTLDEAIDLVVGAGLELHVEIKADVGVPTELAAAVGDVLARRSARDRAGVIVSSFGARVLLNLGPRCPDVRRAFLLERWRRWSVPTLRIFGVEGLHPHGALVRRAVRPSSVHFVNAWTINEPDEARRLAGLGVHGLITDRVVEIRQALAA